jgi:UDP-N-acetylglucosamine 1-carboxyvinyltransferase
MGARIEGIGTHRLVIKGVTHLRGTEYKIIPDRIEAGTFMVATVITGGDVILESVIPEHLVAVIETLGTMGADITVRKDNVHIKGNKRIRSTDITTLPYPGVPTDMQAQLMALLTLGDGIGIITEKVYPDRFLHVAELNRMGARIRKEGNSAIVQGVPRLHGAPVMASDLRASAALVLAALAAKGQTEITRVYHLDRGYYRLEERLQRLGGMVRRVIDKRFIVMPSEGS